eukprot:5918667-Alexandrium_andersonii.AAC.1
MSASLVGSEMCIRDRNIGTFMMQLLLLRGAREARHLPVPSSGCGVVPVSYTHLTLPTICSV